MAKAGVESNAKDLARAFRRADKSLQNVFVGLVDEYADKVADEIRDGYRTVVTPRTGNLLKGVRVLPIKESDGSAKLVMSQAEHAHLVEFGTGDRSHPITGTSGRMPKKPVVIPVAVRNRRGFTAKAERLLDKELRKIDA